MPDSVIAFGSTGADAKSLDDAALLKAIAWRKSADRKLVTAARAGDVATFCQALRKSLLRRQNGASSKTRQSGSLPLLLQPLWSQHAWEDAMTSTTLSDVLIDLQSRTEKKPGKASRKASQRVRRAFEEAPLSASPWAQVTWLTVLGNAADLLDDRTLMSLWRQLLVNVVGQLDTASETTTEAENFADDRQLLMAGELPWLSGLMFADVKGAAKIQRRAQAELRTQLEATTDGDGSPHARALHRLPLTLAVFVRSISAGRAAGKALLNRAASERFQQLMTRAAVMAHADGQLALSNGSSFATGSLLRTASKIAGLRPKAAPGQRLNRIPDDAPTARQQATRRLPKVKRVRGSRSSDAPSSQSDWAELTCMRNNWQDGGDSCIIAHHGAVPQLSVTGFERRLIDGAWELSVEVNGKSVELTSGWSCVCWFSDDDADYVELEQQTEAGLVLMRQVLLSRTDHWLLLADNARVTPDSDLDVSTIHITSRLPLAGDVHTEENRWTREMDLEVEKLHATAYPLALPQERVQKSDGTLSVADGDLVLEQNSSGGGVTMPLLLDWSPDRQQVESRWRQLSVAEDGKRLPQHIACGQRLQIDRHQWLFYHSHHPGETGRTILGHHTPHETVIAEFSTTGEVDPIVLVEQ